MTELRSVDPRTLKPNPNNPRRTPVPPAMDEQLVASIKAIGIIQPPVVREADGELIVKAGGRRVKAAITAQLPTIDVLVKNDDDDANIPMVSLSENLIRASMTSVDIWRGVEDLEKRGWNEQAIADALNLPVRTIKRLKLLAHIHPPMLDVMAQGSMPVGGPAPHDRGGEPRRTDAGLEEEQAEEGSRGLLARDRARAVQATDPVLGSEVRR